MSSYTNCPVVKSHKNANFSIVESLLEFVHYTMRKHKMEHQKTPYPSLIAIQKSNFENSFFNNKGNKMSSCSRWANLTKYLFKTGRSPVTSLGILLQRLRVIC